MLVLLMLVSFLVSGQQDQLDSPSDSSSPRLTIRALLNPAFYNDLGINRDVILPQFSIFYTNLEIDYSTESVGVVLMRYHGRYSTDMSLPPTLRGCIVGHTTFITGLAFNRSVPLSSFLNIIPRVGLSMTNDILESSSSDWPICSPPPLGGRRIGVLVGVEVRWKILHDFHLSAVVVGNTMLSRNIRHLLVSPTVSISF